MSLIEITDLSDFQKKIASFQKQWPRAYRWLSWWLIPEHAMMLFPSIRTMPEDLAAKLPETTNAEEAMHATIYRTVQSRHNPFFQGLDGLLAVEKVFRQEYQSALCM
jgi:hypothetical protein